MVGAVEDVDGVREEVRDGVEGFDSAFGTAGKIDDERAMTNDGNAARENGGGSFLGAFAAKLLGNAGDGAFRNVESGFGSIVARAETGTAGSEDEVDAAGVCEFTELAAKAGGVIRAAKRGGDFPSELTRTFDESGAGEVLALTAGDGITDGEDGDAHD